MSETREQRREGVVEPEDGDHIRFTYHSKRSGGEEPLEREGYVNHVTDVSNSHGRGIVFVTEEPDERYQRWEITLPLNGGEGRVHGVTSARTDDLGPLGELEVLDP